MSDGYAGAKVRASAASAVDAVVSHGRSLDAALMDVEQRVPANDRPLLKMLCYGVLRFHWQLREELGVLLDRPLKRRDSIIESLLAIGIYQLRDTRVPDHAAVSMTVEAARLLRRPKFAGLINAVLRNYTRQNISAREPQSDAARFNHPGWMIRAIRKDWPQQWQQILKSNNERAPMWLRVNRRHKTPQQYLDDGQLDGDLLAGFDQAVRLHTAMPVDELPGFHEGIVSVQDGAAQIPAPWLLASGGVAVLDACAAPGGKTGHLLELLGESGRLTAIDSDPERLAGIADNLSRLGLDATVKLADASKVGGWEKDQVFDRILLDAPCSATGVIRRHPDIKLNRRRTDIAGLAARQAEMLRALWTILNPGGRLLYVTCSVLSAENDQVIGDFLADTPDSREERLLQNNNIRDVMIEKPSGYQVLPGTVGLDGFYFACLRKAS